MCDEQIFTPEYTIPASVTMHGQENVISREILAGIFDAAPRSDRP